MLLQSFLVINALGCIHSFNSLEINISSAYPYVEENVTDVEIKLLSDLEKNMNINWTNYEDPKLIRNRNLEGNLPVRRFLIENATFMVDPNPCLHGGVGIIIRETMVCLCLENYGGYHCEYRTDVCQVYGCVDSSSTCMPLAGGGFSCSEAGISCCDQEVCPEGWHCVPNDDGPGYSCENDSEYKLEHCQNTSKNLCTDNVCQNGGQCHNFSCVCLLPFTGIFCELLIDYCKTDPCPASIACHPKFGGYTCQCPSNYMGIHCNTPRRGQAIQIEDLGFLYNNVQYVGMSSVYCLHAASLGSLPHVLVKLGKDTQVELGTADFVSLKSTRENIMNSCPSQFQPLTESKFLKIFHHEFEKSGIHNISIVAENMGHFIAQYSYSVRVEQNTECNLSTVLYHCAPSPASPTLYTRRSPIAIMSHTDLNCPQFHVRRRWNLYRILKSNVTRNKVKYNLIYSIKNFDSYFAIPAFSIPAGEYYVNLTECMETGETNISSHALTWFHVKILPLKAIITGGLLINQYWGSEVEIDASKSYDPNVPEEEQEPLSFSWSCYLFEGEQRAQKGRHVLCNEMSEHHLDSTESKLVLPANTLLPNSTVLFRVFVSKAPYKSVMAEQYLKLVGGDTPLLRIRCWHNCEEERVDPNKVTSLEAYCVSCKNISREIVDSRWNVNPSIEPSRTEFGLENPLLLIYENSLENEKQYRIVFKAMHINVLYRGGVFVADKIGQVETKIITNHPPHSGYCMPSPIKGFAITTYFAIYCHNFQDRDTPLTYEVAHFKSNDYKGILVGYDIGPHIKDITLAAGRAKNNYLTSLKVHVADRLGVYSHYDYNITVMPFITYSDPYQALLKIKSMGASKQSRLALMSAAGNTRDVVQTVMTIAISYSDLMESEEATAHIDNDIAIRSKYEVRDMLMKYLQREPILTVSGCKHAATALEKVLSATDGYCNSSSTRQAIDVLSRVVSFLHSSYTQETLHGTDVQETGTSVVEIVSLLLSTLGRTDKQLHYFSHKETVKIRTILTRKVLDMLKHFAKLLLLMNAYGEHSKNISCQDIDIIYKRSSFTDLQNDNSILSVVEFDDSNSMQHGHLNFYMVRFKRNPFPWHYSSQDIISPIIFSDLRNENGTIASVGADISFNAKLPSMPRTSWATFHTNSPWSTEDIRSNVLKVVVSAGGKLIIQVHGLDNDKEIRVVVKRIMPSKIEDFWSESADVSHDNTNVLRGRKDVLRIVDLRAEKGDVFYVGVAPLQETANSMPTMTQRRFYRKVENAEYFNRGAHTMDQDSNSTPTYAIAAYVLKCLSWSEKNGWEPACEAVSLPDQVLCRCPNANRMTSITYTSIPLDTVSARTEGAAASTEQEDNYVIAFLVTLLLALFLLLCVWGWQLDGEEKPLQGLSFLPSNDPAHAHEYLVAVRTGHLPGAETTSPIAAQLEGTRDSSAVHVLTDPRRHILRTAAWDWFVLRTATSLGELQELRLWSGHSGPRPSWYCDEVMALDAATGHVTFFVVRRWFSPATISCSVLPTPDPQLYSFLPRFLRNLAQQLDSGYHAWFAILRSHPQSSLTRCQRVGMALMQLSFFLIISMTMQVLLVKDDPTFAAGAYSHYTPQWTEFVGGVVAAVVTFIVNCVLAELFMRTASGNRHRFSTISYLDPPTDYSEGIGQGDTPSPTRVNRVIFRRLPTGASDEPGTRRKAADFVGRTTIKEYAFPIPHQLLYVWWFVTSATVIISLFVTVQSSMSYSWVASLRLLISFAISLMISIFVLEPVRLLAATACCTILSKDITIDDRGYFPRDTMRTRKQAFEITRSSVANVPLSVEKLKLLQRNSTLETKCLSLLSQLSLYAVLLIIIFNMVHEIEENKLPINTRSTPYPFSGRSKGEVRNERISSQAQFINYVQESLLPEMYSHTAGSLFRVPRIKQVRSERCMAVSYKNLSLGLRCLDNYLFIVGDTEDHGPSWTQLRRLYLNSPESEWHYQDLDLPYIGGNLSWYHGGGYITQLKRDYTESTLDFSSLLEAGWLDSKTVALLVEFSLYNPNRDSIATTSLMGERIAASGYATHLRTNMIKMLSKDSTNEIHSFVRLLIFIVLMGAILCIEIHKLVSSQYFEYIKNTWNGINLLIIGMGIVTAALHLHRRTLIEADASHARSLELENYFCFQPIVYLDRLIFGFLSIMLFFIIMKVWQFLSIWTQLKTIMAVLCSSSLSLASFGILLCISVASFATFGYFIALSHSRYFRNPIRAFVTTLQFLMGYFELNTVTVLPLGYLFFILCFISMTLIFYWGFQVIVMKKFYVFQKQVFIPDTKDIVLSKAMENIFNEEEQELLLLAGTSRTLDVLENKVRNHYGRSANLQDFVRLQNNLKTIKNIVTAENFDSQISALVKKM